MIQRLFVAIGLVTSLALASCGGLPHQMSFLPNCAPEPQSGPNVVAKVRYKVKVKNGTNSDGSEIIKTETQLKALNEPMEGTAPPADIRLPVTVELLNDQDTVLLTRSISDPELNNENLHGHSNTATVSSDFKDRNRPRNPDPIDFFSTQGNRFIDTVEYEWKGNFGNTGSWAPKLTKRQVFLVDQGDVIACNAKVVRPTPPPPPCNAQLLTAASSQVSTFGPGLRFPSYVAVGPNGSIYAKTGDGLVKFTGASGTATPVALVSGLKAQASDPAGNMYYYYSSDHAIHKIAPTGGESVFKQGSFDELHLDVDFKDVSGMAADSQGNVYIIDRHSVTAGGTTTSWNDLRKITSNGTVSTLVSKPANEWRVGNVVTAGADGTVYIAGASAGDIHVVSPTGALSTMPIAAGANVGQIGGMAVDCGGNLYVSEESNHRILTITSAGAVSTLAGTGSAGNTNGKATEATFKEPMGLALDAVNNALYVADSGNGRIRKISAPVPDNVDALSLQGFAEKSVSANPENTQELIVGADHTIASVETFIHDSMRAITGEDRNRLDDRPLHSWVSQFKGPPTSTFRFRSTNGKMLNGRGETAEHTARWFLPTPDASLFDGSECKGRLEWSIQPPNTSKSIVIYSNEFVLATKAAPTASTLRLRSGVTQNATANQVVVTSTYADDGAKGLQAKLRAAAGGMIPEDANVTYGSLDADLIKAGVTIETVFQPGTVTEGDVAIGVPNGAGIPAVGVPQTGEVPLNVMSTITVTLPWPSQAIFDRFGVQKPVTGYLVRVLKYNGKTLATLLGNQVTWATETKETIQSRQGGGGGGAVTQPAPTVTSLSSTSGGGLGTTITITGTNFRTPATVKFGAGAVLGTGLTVNSATSITVTLPTLAAGAHAVVVTNTDNNTTGTSPTPYTVTAPTITGIAPNNGLAGSSTTITGTNFRAGATVTIGGQAATVTGTTGTTGITVTVPAQAAGAKNVVVTNTDTTSVTSAGGYTVNGGGGGGAPTITSVAPAPPNPVPVGNPFTITGTNFVNGATVTVGGTNCLAVTIDSATQLTVLMPAGAPSGIQDVVVTNPDTQSATSVGAIFVP